MKKLTAEQLENWKELMLERVWAKWEFAYVYEMDIRTLAKELEPIVQLVRWKYKKTFIPKYSKVIFKYLEEPVKERVFEILNGEAKRKR